jgi:hypothetical protein
MPKVNGDKNFKSNMPKIDGSKKEKEIMEQLRKPGRLSEKERELIRKQRKPKKLPDAIKNQLKEGVDFITGKSASRRIASGGEVKKMESGGEVRASRKSARKSIDGCAVRGKTRAARKV